MCCAFVIGFTISEFKNRKSNHTVSILAATVVSCNTNHMIVTLLILISRLISTTNKIPSIDNIKNSIVKTISVIFQSYSAIEP